MIKRNRFTRILISIASILACVPMLSLQNPPDKPVVIGYVAGYSGLINTETIDVAKLTHINYAFVDIKSNRAWLHNEITDTVNFRKLNELKSINPSLKILISIGGWSWSKNFSDAVLSDTSRQAFAASSVAIIGQYGLDGVDIDWEYPGMRGDGNMFRPEDQSNYTLMFRAIREELDKLQQQTGRSYLLTTAVGGFASFIRHTEMDKAQQYLDYINLMTYDYGDDVSVHHTNLYATGNNPEENSADKAVKDFIAAGVPADKLVMGIAFYGRGYILETDGNKGLNQKVVSRTWAGGYTYIKDSLIDQQGYKSYWDKKAKAPYLFNKEKKIVLSYDNEKSVKAKCDYVKKNKMGGVMFWEYSSDPKEYLLNTIQESLY